MSQKKAQKKKAATDGRIPADMQAILIESAYSLKAYKEIMLEAEKSIAMYHMRQENVFQQLSNRLNIPKESLHVDAGLGIWKDTRKND